MEIKEINQVKASQLDVVFQQPLDDATRSKTSRLVLKTLEEPQSLGNGFTKTAEFQKTAKF